MNQVAQNQMHKIKPLVEGWNETLIWSCLQGHMGRAWVDDIESPRSVQIITADFCFFAGDPCEELVRHVPEDFPAENMLIAAKTEDWEPLIEACYPYCYDKFMRYAIKKEPDVFDRHHLQSIVDGLDSAYELKLIDESIYRQIQHTDWAEDLCSQFPTYEDYASRGLGYAVLHNGAIVSGASSYTIYDAGIEIEIDTHIDYRRKGLALAVGAKLILACLDKGLYPSWDAANLGSVALSEKLGYHFDHDYVTYMVPADSKQRLNIRRPDKSDAEEVYQLFDTVLEDTFHRNNIDDLVELMQEEKDGKRAYFELDLATNGQSRHFLLAELDDQIVGTIEYGQANQDICNGSEGALADYMEIGTVFVHPDYQKRGIGSRLVKAVMKALVDDGCSECCLDSGYPSAQEVWTKKFGPPTYHLKDYWGEGADHMIWKVIM